MIRTVGSWLMGAWIALVTPVWVRGGRLRTLLQQTRPVPGERRDPERTLRAARSALRLLARLPLSPWRNTCLYRSVAVCRCLRTAGVPARLRIGVRAGETGGGNVAAHAWVESEAAVAAGILEPESGSVAFSPLRLRTDGGG
jgi:hypothetical protein